MIQVVLDTNVLVAGLRSNRGASYAILDKLAAGTWQPNVSVALALEYEDVLKRRGMIPALSLVQIDQFLRFFFSRSNLPIWVERLRPTLHDPDDDRILEVAVHCGASIVTHNVSDFLAARRYRVEILTPVEFLRRLKG